MSKSNSNSQSAQHRVALLGNASSDATPFSALPPESIGSGNGRKPPTPVPAGQWRLGPDGEVPPRAFEMHGRERQRFHLLAHAVPLEPDPTSEIERLGSVIFDATYGAKEWEFAKTIDAVQLEVERLTTDRSRLASEVEHIPATVETETAEPKWPQWLSVKWWGLVAFLFVFWLSSAGAVGNIVLLLLPVTRSLVGSFVVAFVWMSLAVAAKWGLCCVPGRLRNALHWAVTFIGLIGAALWLWGLITVYGGSVNLNNFVATGILVQSRALPFIGQLLAEFSVGVACLGGALSMLSFERLTELNQNRERVSAGIAQVDRELGQAMATVGKAEGNLAELHASREAFIAEGIAIVHLRQAKHVLVAQNARLIAVHDQLIDKISE